MCFGEKELKGDVVQDNGDTCATEDYPWTNSNLGGQESPRLPKKEGNKMSK